MFLSCHIHVCSESTLCNWLIVKELFPWKRRDICKLSCCNGTRTQSNIVRKRTLNHLAKLTSLTKSLSVCLRTMWLYVRVPLQSHGFYYCNSMQPLNVWIKLDIRMKFWYRYNIQSFEWLLGRFLPNTLTFTNDWMSIMLCLLNQIKRFPLTSRNIAAVKINFLLRDTKLVISAVHVESVASVYVCFPRHLLSRLISKIFVYIFTWYHEVF